MAVLKNISFGLILAIFLILISSCPAIAVHHYPRGEDVKYRHGAYTHGSRYDAKRGYKRDLRYGWYRPERSGRYAAHTWNNPVAAATYP